MSAEKGFVKVPCFEKMKLKIAKTLLHTYKNKWILVNDINISRQRKGVLKRKTFIIVIQDFANTPAHLFYLACFFGQLGRAKYEHDLKY